MRAPDRQRNAKILAAAAVLLATLSITALLLASTTASAADPPTGSAPVVAGIPSGWAVVAGRPDQSTRIVVRHDAVIESDLCVQQGTIGAAVLTDTDIVSTGGSGDPLRIRAVAVFSGDVLTGGSAIRAQPRGSDLPGLGSPSVASGTVVEKIDGTGSYDTTGADPRVLACIVAQEAVAASAESVGALPPDNVLGKLTIPNDGTIEVGTPKPGSLGVIDFRRITLGRSATLVLDGGGDSSSVLVIQVRTRLRTRLGSRIVLTGGLQPSNVVIYVDGEFCQIGERTVGAGTLMCPRGQVRVRQGTLWDGALIGGLRQVDIGARVVVTGNPFGGP